MLLGSTPRDWTSWISVCKGTTTVWGVAREKPAERVSVVWECFSGRHKGILCLRSRSQFPATPASSARTRCRCIWQHRREWCEAGPSPSVCVSSVRPPSHRQRRHLCRPAGKQNSRTCSTQACADSCIKGNNAVHRAFTVMDDSLIFCSTMSLAEKPSSRKENSNSVFMVTQSPLDWSLLRGTRAHSDCWKLLSSIQFNQNRSPYQKRNVM